MTASRNSRLTPLFCLSAFLVIIPFAYGQPTIDPKIEGTYESTRTFHELSIRTIFVFSANGLSVPIISGKTVLPTSLDPNDDQWLDDLEDFAKNLNKTCADDLGNDATECAAGTVDVVKAIYDVNKWLVERMATKWNLDLLSFTPLDEL